MRGIPPDVSIVNATHAKCWRCGTVMICAEPWQLLDLCRRHTAESHPTAPASAPPLPASAVLWQVRRARESEMSRHISDLLPNVTSDHINDDDIVLDAVILMRVASTVGDGKPRLTLAATPDLDWLLQIGMLRAGLEIVTTDIGRDEDDG